jgi:methyl-accepting chemotaxis protein
MLGAFSSTSEGWVVLVCSTVADILTDTNHAIRNAAIASVVCLLVVSVFAFVLLGSIVKRITSVVRRLDQMAGGDLTSEVPKSNSRNETGVLIRSLGEVVEMINAYISDIRETLIAIENGNLAYTSRQDYKGDFVDIKKALTGITAGLSTTMGSIMESSVQVAEGSRQIAHGTQTLAQGSSEQASTIQELSDSTNVLARKTKDNALLADKAANLAETIKDSAEKGTGQMDELLAAVNDINQASQNISKVIKVIDDIAFQTNILALNAAVEAARAGQHGKGFAVVAEEVRNLASKSAEAAKDTGNMIQSSMEKAELGFRIAGETAESFREIVTGINESSQLIADIAKSSEEQSTDITHINTGIDQVAQVTEQNSAATEESAAAAEEMSGQSALLQELVAKFKLK